MWYNGYVFPLFFHFFFAFFSPFFSIFLSLEKLKNFAVFIVYI